MKVSDIFGTTLHIQRRRRNAMKPYKRRNTLDKYYNTKPGMEDLKNNINRFIDLVQKNELLKGMNDKNDHVIGAWCSVNPLKEGEQDEKI